MSDKWTPPCPRCGYPLLKGEDECPRCVWEGADVVTVDQIAARFQVATKTVYRHLEGGKLRGAKIGTAWRIRREDAEAWFDSLVPTRSERPARRATSGRRPAKRGSLLSVLDGGKAA